MIAKATLEKQIDNYSFKVRIPIYNKIKGVAGATPTDELPTAYIATLPGITPTYKLDDLVYVGFEDDKKNQPIIIGLVYNSKERS